MNTSKHTPGPWRIGKNHGAVVADHPAPGLRGSDYEDAYGGHLIAESIAHQNRPLIAAAPELLEALIGLDEAFCRAGTMLTREERTEDRLRLVTARAAIAKATQA